MKINQLNSLACDMVGDGQTPNVFFVTLKGDVSPRVGHGTSIWILARTGERAQGVWARRSYDRHRLRSWPDIRRERNGEAGRSNA